MFETSPIDANDIKPCFLCKKGVMHCGSPVFYELTLASCVVDAKEMLRLGALETMMGNVAIARAMAPNTTIAHRIAPSRHFICAECALDKSVAPLQFMEGDDG